MSTGRAMQGRRTHSGADKVLRKGAAGCAGGVMRRAKWYATACVSGSGGVRSLFGWQFGAGAGVQRRGGGDMAAGRAANSLMEYQPELL